MCALGHLRMGPRHVPALDAPGPWATARRASSNQATARARMMQGQAMLAASPVIEIRSFRARLGWVSNLSRPGLQCCGDRAILLAGKPPVTSLHRPHLWDGNLTNSSSASRFPFHTGEADRGLASLMRTPANCSRVSRSAWCFGLRQTDHRDPQREDGR